MSSHLSCFILLIILLLWFPFIISTDFVKADFRLHMYIAVLLFTSNCRFTLLPPSPLYGNYFYRRDTQTIANRLRMLISPEVGPSGLLFISEAGQPSLSLKSSIQPQPRRAESKNSPHAFISPLFSLPSFIYEHEQFIPFPILNGRMALITYASFPDEMDIFFAGISCHRL